MKKIALVGSTGFVGSALVPFLKKEGHEVTEVIRSNYDQMKNGDYDVVINSAMPSKRFWASQNPEDDYRETVEKTKDLYKNWTFKKFIHISTVSARCELDHVYGQHKAEAENVCRGENSLIVRLSSMYGPTLKKGALIDILKGQKVFVSAESRYPFASLDFVCQWIATHFDRSGLVELGAGNTITLNEVAQFLGKQIEFEGRVDVQEIQNPEPDFPDAKDVLNFLKEAQQEGLVS